MRNAFADEILTIAGADPRVVLLSADIGNRLFDKYKAAFPDRFYNTGVAEANNISMAAGLCATGMRPVCYTITPFITARCYEQIKVDVCYHEQPVVIVGTGSGLSYASLGATHHSLEDIAIMRALPNMQVLAPADANELRSCLRHGLQSNQPTYIRIGKKNEPVLFEEPPSFSMGKWIQMQTGKDVCLLSTGNLLPEAIAAAAKLSPAPAVFSCASIKPLDQATLHQVFEQYEVVVTLEEHGIIGGFGSAVAEWLVDQPKKLRARLLRLAAPDIYLHYTGEQQHAREMCGLTAETIAKRIKQERSFV